MPEFKVLVFRIDIFQIFEYRKFPSEIFSYFHQQRSQFIGAFPLGSVLNLRIVGCHPDSPDIVPRRTFRQDIVFGGEQDLAKIVILQKLGLDSLVHDAVGKFSP